MATKDQQPWSFDVSSLMVLIGEEEELKYRLSRRTWLECIAATPVVGLQNYVRSYDLLLETGPLTYFSPYGCKSAPLRNTQLTNSIRVRGLLDDGRYTVYKIPPNPNPSCLGIGNSIPLLAWIIATWIFLGGLIAFLVLVPDRTWVGITSCASLTGWSIFLRLVEFANVQPTAVKNANITDPQGFDAVFVMGRDNSGFVLEGSRKDVKNWTSRGLYYKKDFLCINAHVWQNLTRIGSLLVLLFIFSVIPNGSTMDQVAFIFLNGMAQANVLIGQRLHSSACFAELDRHDNYNNIETRTDVYAMLLNRFKDVPRDWVAESGLLPKTAVWDEWKDEVVRRDQMTNPKELYREIEERHRVSPPPPPAPITSCTCTEAPTPTSQPESK